MINRTINIRAVAEIAKALDVLNDKVVFVGGAIVSLYIDDVAVTEIRPTHDVDLTLQIASLSHWQKVQDELANLGFQPDPFGNAICSYKYNNIPVDIMSTQGGPLGPTNRWYLIGFENLKSAKANNQEIRILSAPCFLATKFEAFIRRGSDYRTSHDIEDVFYILENRATIVDEIIKSDPRIKAFLKEQFDVIIQKGLLTEVLMAHLNPSIIEESLPLLEDKVMNIVEK